jgi:uncharacterized protein YjbI with pentapeptide repeats
MDIALPTITGKLDTLKDLHKILMKDETLSSASIGDEDITGVKARNFTANEAHFEKVNFTQAKLDKTGLSDIELLNCDLIATALPESSWRRILIDSCRCSGVQLQTSTLRDVTFTDCKLNLANFRFSKLKNVRFKNCVLDEADFYSAELENVDFQNCNMDRTEFSSSRLKHVDLRSSEIVSITGIGNLSGAIIDSMQLITLAPLLASELKITVKDD